MLLELWHVCWPSVSISNPESVRYWMLYAATDLLSDEQCHEYSPVPSLISVLSTHMQFASERHDLLTF